MLLERSGRRMTIETCFLPGSGRWPPARPSCHHHHHNFGAAAGPGLEVGRGVIDAIAFEPLQVQGWPGVGIGHP